jgi:ComF family protein
VIRKLKVNISTLFNQAKYSDCLLCHGQIAPLHELQYSSLGTTAAFPPNQLTSQLICAYCQSKLPYLSHACRVCALPLTAMSNNGSNNICGECLSNTPIYQRSCAAFLYESPVSDLITQLKFNHQFRHLNLLCNSLVLAIRHQYLKSDLPCAMLPVPLHPKRLRQRGFNQATIIAQKLSSPLNIPVYPRLLNRRKQTSPQINLSAVERKRNLKGAFSLAKQHSQLPFSNTHIAIVDDVMTTGATANEMARSLISLGAQRVDIWCLARAIVI